MAFRIDAHGSIIDSRFDQYETSRRSCAGTIFCDLKITIPITGFAAANRPKSFETAFT